MLKVGDKVSIAGYSTTKYSELCGQTGIECII